MTEHERQPVVKKLTLESRAKSLEQKNLLVELTGRARELEKRLFAAYGAAPTQIQMREATQQLNGLLIDLARDARGLALQYRAFNVGAAVIGLRKTKHPAHNPWAVMFDANTKPTFADQKWCAEQYLMDRATSSEEALERILAFVVVAEPQTDDDSKKTQMTLTPCKLCRDRMARLIQEGRQIVRPDTEVLTAHAEETGLRKIQQVPDLLTFHGESLEID